MNKKILLIIAVVVLAIAGYVLASRLPQTPKTGAQATSTPLQFSWRFTEIGEDATTGAPRTQVTLKVGTTSYPSGTYIGSCVEVESGQLSENEKAAAMCWFAGGGNEIGVFEEGGRLLVKLGDLDEGSAETDGFRGNFRTLYEIGADPRVATIYTRINQGASALDVKVTPLMVLEDSRCPVDVQCIQAGTVKVQARLESDSDEDQKSFELGKAVVFESRTITLTDVEPIKLSQQTLKPTDYRLTFRLEKKSETVQ